MKQLGGGDDLWFALDPDSTPNPILDVDVFVECLRETYDELAAVGRPPRFRGSRLRASELVPSVETCRKPLEENPCAS
jgi:hypothetical protein